MARRRTEPDTPSQEQPATELETAQAEIEQYGSVDDLTKALSDAQTDLSKAQRAAESDEDDGDDTNEDAGNPETEDDADADGTADDTESDEDEDSDLDGDDESEDSAPESTKKSLDGDSAGEQFLKEMLLDADGNPTPEAEAIEVSPILDLMTNTLAKSLDQLEGQIREQLVQLAAVATLVKAQTTAVVDLVKSQTSLQTDLRKSQRAAAQHQPTMLGAVFTGSKDTPTNRQQPREALSKSQAQEGIMAALRNGDITTEQFGRAMPMIDSQGADAALALLPDTIADRIRTGSFT